MTRRSTPCGTAGRIAVGLTALGLIALLPAAAGARYIPIPRFKGNTYTYHCGKTAKGEDRMARFSSKHRVRPTPTTPFKLSLEQLAEANVGAYVRNAPTSPGRARLGLYARRGTDAETLRKLGLTLVRRPGRAPQLRFVRSWYDPSTAREAMKLLQRRADSPQQYVQYRP